MLLFQAAAGEAGGEVFGFAGVSREAQERPGWRGSWGGRVQPIFCPLPSPIILAHILSSLRF